MECFLISRTGGPGEVDGSEGEDKGRPSVCVICLHPEDPEHPIPLAVQA